ncbi:hypothetical protein CSC94_16125 [Zhengella mangrovi]|uniref:Sel1 repeat family protein n=1 Tax=Zhengella mangrovi TaxID=1982044 RepID=A0A2G1QKR9_9HYPH|nr:tetratricopeptide repeat protein [Zhengella mangrovi]PHP66123.1 hypothetical protein CSC94_16125 [Zhengella mangrovi]
MKRTLALLLMIGTAVPALAAGDTAEKVLPSLADRVAKEAGESTDIDPERFGQHPADKAFGAFQRGLYITALNLAKPLAEKGDPAAQTLVAEILSRGLGVPSNPAEAAKWYIKAAKNGNPEAKFQYALLLTDGKYVAKDTDEAFRLMGEAAAAGNALARFNYAQMIVDRKPGPTGLAEAAEWYDRAARQGLPDAQYAMAMILAEGNAGRERDEKTARKWLELAARGGYDSAMLDLAVWLVDGRGGARDFDTGFRWMRMAALEGNVAAQNGLAKLYRMGLGTEGNPIEAAAWYILARRAGLDDPEMNVFLDGLTKDQMKKAIERANRLR